MSKLLKRTQTNSNALTETIRRRRSPMKSYSVKCAYCDHERKYMIMESKLPFEGIEHMYCPKCGRDFKHDRGTGIAYTLENILNK